MKSNADLVQAIRAGLPSHLEWTERDALLLDVAESQARDLDRLERGEVDGPPLGVLRECRNQRVALGRLIGLVAVPDEPSTGSLHGRKAALARWRRDGEAA